jgi:hypothetical protein
MLKKIGSTNDEDNSAEVTGDLEMAFAHLFAVWDDHSASLASCIHLLGSQSTCFFTMLLLPSLLTMYRPSCPVAPNTVAV